MFPWPKGNSEEIVGGWVADLFHYPCGFKSGQYTEYSSAFESFG